MYTWQDHEHVNESKTIGKQTSESYVLSSLSEDPFSSSIFFSRIVMSIVIIFLI